MLLVLGTNYVLDAINGFNSKQYGEYMMQKLKCFIGWHKWKLIKHTNMYEGDMGMELKCVHCGKEEYDSGQPLW